MKTKPHADPNKIYKEILYADLDFIRQQIDDEMRSGRNPTGVFAKTTQDAIRRLEHQERRLIRKIQDVESPVRHPVPVFHEGAHDFDFVNLLDETAKAREEQYIRELHEARLRGTEREDRER